jgi:hypothetical protein
MQRAAATGLVAVVLALVAPSCAKGNGSSAADVTELSPTSGAGAEDAGPDSACAPCGAGEKCSAGICLPVDTDADGDGFKLATDCNDNDPAVHPGAAEICNGKDDNCDGKTDEGFDADGDGVPSCAVGSTPADCDDKDPAVHPGAKETCNGKDDNCDGTIDEGFDKDNDGFYSCAHGTIPVDCDDTDAKIHPGGTEICNGKDDDCNGKIDEIPATLTGSLSPPVNTHWTVAGTASIVNGWGQLTQDLPDQSGALWWYTPSGAYTFDAFDMTSTFWIQNKANGADGMTFAWVPGTTNVVGNGASTYGIGGLGGYSVVIDTFLNVNEPAVPYLAILQNAAAPVAYSRISIPNVRDSANHTLRVRLTPPGNVSVWVDGINYIFDFPIPGYAAFSGRWGFTAGTGSASEAHWVTNVSMSFPNGQGCVP